MWCVGFMYVVRRTWTYVYFIKNVNMHRTCIKCIEIQDFQNKNILYRYVGWRNDVVCRVVENVVCRVAESCGVQGGRITFF